MMNVSPFSTENAFTPLEISSQPTNTVIVMSGSPKILTNLILMPPPGSQSNSEEKTIQLNSHQVCPLRSLPESHPLIFERCDEKNDIWKRRLFENMKQYEDARVKGKLNRKGKRDGENIRTYARYDSVIQALEQELEKHQIVPTRADHQMLDQFQMKSKRSLERIFFYLLLAKRENKLSELLPDLKTKIRAKVQEKGSHRTSEFLSSLQNCIEKYIDAAQKLEEASSQEEAKSAFSIAYLSDFVDNGNQKKPHHNKVKGIDNCLQIYRIIIGKEEENRQTKMEVQPQICQMILLQEDIEDKFPQPKRQCMKICLDQSQKNQKKDAHIKMQDESFRAEEEGGVLNPQEKKKKQGVKNRKQDDRDIQKYAKFDIVSDSCLEFLRMQKLHKNIPEVCKKLSQRSLHFFFVILALIQKEGRGAEFLTHLEDNYERKVKKRYSRRSEYFREKLHKSFFNLIHATRALFEGRVNEALDIAYEVRSNKKTHPAKASQQKKCREIYDAVSCLVGTEEENREKLEILLQKEKGFGLGSSEGKQMKSQIKKGDSTKVQENHWISSMGINNICSFNSYCKIQEQEQLDNKVSVYDPMKQEVAVIFPIPQRPTDTAYPSPTENTTLVQGNVVCLHGQAQLRP